jgi:hypothetical protein
MLLPLLVEIKIYWQRHKALPDPITAAALGFGRFGFFQRSRKVAMSQVWSP